MNWRAPASSLSLVILAILVISNAHAVGITNPPSQRDFVFNPGEAFNINIGVGGAERIGVYLYTRNPAHPETLGTPEDDNVLSYVRINDPAPNTSDRTVTVQFALPQILKPGDYAVDFYATELAEIEGTVTATASTKIRFTIHVLSEEKRIEILGFSVPPIPEGMNANASITIVSRTKQNLNNVLTEVRLYRNDTVVATARSKSIALLSAQTATLNVTLDTENIRGGDYPANGTVYFDEFANDTWTETLKIGTLHVDVSDATRQFVYNTTNKFNFIVSNRWNRELQEVYATVSIGSQGKKSASLNIPAFGQTSYELYFDRDETLLPGTVTANVTVFFKDYDPPTKTYVQKQESFLLPVDIIVPLVPQKKWWEGETLVYVLAGGLLLLLLAIIILILILIFRRPKQEAPRQAAPPAATPREQRAPPKAQ
jgi:hypothetical protein